MMMTDKRNSTTVYALLFVLFISLNSPTSFAVAKEDAPVLMEAEPPAAAADHEPYHAVNGFCAQRPNRKDREFCLRALKTDPRSAAARDLLSLLQISVDLAVKKTNEAHQFLITLSKKKNNSATENQSLKAVLKDCSFAYSWCLKELEMIPRELLDDAALASYDALMASDALQSCNESLKKSNIANHSISRMHRDVAHYVLLCVDIARGI
ncbi:OLC1v1021435C1 [Oldenlandia corymbosa var. corymbosa]|uniref:OLC1v1021435C1 n=1 Tax=Oldenlandia corymbosa var. corymbosa TaxID=529605 RepID=A0AAV1BWV5_OLDCO|nr:OLC1v1021435C1 [Oldenlandia corymbosa var. corymbosa]